MPSRTMDSMRVPPDLCRRHSMAPVLMVTASASSRTDKGVAGGVDGPGTNRHGPVRPVAAGTACAVHFKEPSGQEASGQLCIGTGFPSGPTNAKEVSAATVPRGQGAPQVVPGVVTGPPVFSSHCTVAGRHVPTGRPKANDGTRQTAARSRNLDGRGRKCSRGRGKGVLAKR